MCSITGQMKRLDKLFGQIGSELWLPWQHIALIELTWRKFCHHRSDFNFSRICFILADIQDRHEISVKFDYEQNRIVQLGVICP